MCPCTGDFVCDYHARPIEELYDELRDLAPREQSLSVDQYDRLRQVRGALRLEGRRAEIVIHQIKTREWDEANGALKAMPSK